MLAHEDPRPESAAVLKTETHRLRSLVRGTPPPQQLVAFSPQPARWHEWIDQEERSRIVEFKSPTDVVGLCSLEEAD
jgi:hypothetical protein